MSGVDVQETSVPRHQGAKAVIEVRWVMRHLQLVDYRIKRERARMLGHA